MRYTNTNNGFKVHKLVIMTKQLGDSGVERIDCNQIDTILPSCI